MPCRRTPHWTLPLAAALTAALVAACDRPPSVELKEWTPRDHDGEKKAGDGTAKQGARSDAGGAPALVEITWRNQCASCHGAQGKGDGPQGPMFKAADLGRADWQARVSDAEIARTIVDGKGRMPKFDLPDEIVQGLVARVRSFREP
ncbi:MAG: cytochrome c [Labilithrix sp.]|nr:cytochrome c [Labilithrix sp.]